MPFFAAMPKASKALTARLVALWSVGEEAVRVMAFVCIVGLTR